MPDHRLPYVISAGDLPPTTGHGCARHSNMNRLKIIPDYGRLQGYLSFVGKFQLPEEKNARSIGACNDSILCLLECDAYR